MSRRLITILFPLLLVFVSETGASWHHPAASCIAKFSCATNFIAMKLHVSILFFHLHFWFGASAYNIILSCLFRFTMWRPARRYAMPLINATTSRGTAVIYSHSFASCFKSAKRWISSAKDASADRGRRSAPRGEGRSSFERKHLQLKASILNSDFIIFPPPQMMAGRLYCVLLIIKVPILNLFKFPQFHEIQNQAGLILCLLMEGDSSIPSDYRTILCFKLRKL